MKEQALRNERNDRGCTCCAGLSRRGFFRVGLGAGLGAALGAGGLAGLPGGAFAAYAESELMLLSCMDPRLVHDVHEQMEARKLRGKYSQVALAGGPVAVVAPTFKKWHAAVWGNLDATIQLHNIKRVFGLAHIDCGAVKIAYGAESLATPERERATLIRILGDFRAEVAKRHPKLIPETGIMALNGSIEMIRA